MRALAVVSVYTMVTFVDEDYWSVRPIGFMRHQRSGHGCCVAPSSTSLRITKDKDRRTIEQHEKWLCLKDVSRGEQKHSNESHRDDGKHAAIRLRRFFGAHRTNSYMFFFVHGDPRSELQQKITCDKALVFGQPSAGGV